MNAHQRRIARRAAPSVELWEPGVDWLGCLPDFDEDILDDEDGEDDTCPACMGDGGDPMNDHILTCADCLGTGKAY